MSNDGLRRILTYGGEQVRVNLIPRARPGTTLRIKVHPGLSVEASVPEGTSEADLDKALRQKARWIWQKLRDFRTVQEHATPRAYVSGESHFYLGPRHLLKVHHHGPAFWSLLTKVMPDWERHKTRLDTMAELVL